MKQGARAFVEPVDYWLGKEEDDDVENGFKYQCHKA